jgi:vacuolar-type H+-ATPase subunit H
MNDIEKPLTHATEKQLEQVIADAREEASILRRHGSEHVAKALEDFADNVSRAAEDYLTWLSEAEAMGRSGKSASWLRKRFGLWLDMGHARYGNRRHREREYRQTVIPQRLHISVMREEAMREAERIVHGDRKRAS